VSLPPLLAFIYSGSRVRRDGGGAAWGRDATSGTSSSDG
jgi:hypothetical protein